MLTREQARDQLKTFEINGGRDRRLAAAKGLKVPLREIAVAMLDLSAAHGWTAEDRRRAQERWTSLVKIEGLSARDRQQLFGVLFPKLSRHIETAWRLLHAMPYQVGHHRRAFRAPHTPEATRERRITWLDHTLRSTLSYDQEVAWFATWAAYLPYGIDGDLGILLAAAIDGNDTEGQAVFEILTASARGEHAVGAMGRHVTRALLSASRPDGWEFIERLLIAAQRQEGLRQVVLEAVDEAHPEAFRRMLRLIVENGLTRFSATIRAAAVWFGFAWDEVNPRRVHEVLVEARAYLEQPRERQAAAFGDEPAAVYMALWASAFEDAPSVIALAARLLRAPEPAMRFVGVHALSQIALPASFQALLPALDDQDLQVAGYAFLNLRRPYGSLIVPDMFERLERLVPRLPRQAKVVKPLVWPWLTVSVTQSDVARELADHLGDRPPMRLVPYLPLMDAGARAHAARQLSQVKAWTSELRQIFLKLIGDVSHGVRQVALDAVGAQHVGDDEMPHLESLLARKSPDLRRGLIQLILSQPDSAVFGSADRLLAGTPPQRLAGLEMLEQLKDTGRLPELCQAVARRYQAQHPAAPAVEAARVERLLAGPTRQAATLEDALGLMDPTQRTRPAKPTVKAKPASPGFPDIPPLVTSAAVALRQSLDALIHEQREQMVVFETPHGPRETLLGQLGYLPALGPFLPGRFESEADTRPVPLQEVWERWWVERPADMRDADGLELLRAMVVASSQLDHPLYRQQVPAWVLTTIALVIGRPQPLNYSSMAHSILYWLLRHQPQPEWAPDFVLDAVETTFALIPQEHLVTPIVPGETQRFGFHGRDWRHQHDLLAWLHLAERYRSICPSQWTPAHHARLWGLLRWFDQPALSAPAGSLTLPRLRANLKVAAEAYEAGVATKADLLDILFEPGQGSWHNFSALRQLSGRKPEQLGQRFSFLGPLVARCRARIIEVELERGDLPTAATGPALALCWSGGLTTLVQLLKAARGDGLVRGHLYGNQSRDAVFSHLIRVSFPEEADTPETFSAAVQAAGISPQRLLNLALFAPQWARHVEQALGWPGLAAGVWWLHAHTKDRHWYLDHDLREAWAAEIGEYTPLNSSDLLDGAVDVAWFGRAQANLAGERWESLYAAASLTSSGIGHSRARLYSDAMTGQVDGVDLAKRIAEKRHQDSVRALGLLPLAAGEARDGDILERYQVIQEFRRGIHKFGSQRQASEKLAARIGLENLARTAGYTDPQRLEWAMEARSASDLAEGSQVVQAGDVSVTLSIDEFGEPELRVARGERVLKAIPAAAKKDAAVVALLERKRELERQKSRVRQSLEESMCRGDSFSSAELQALFAHPVLAPMLSQLVFMVETEPGCMGYPVARGRLLEDHAGTRRLVDPDASLRLAHPHDLLAGSNWTACQRECFVHERIQPFKQIFRELYVLTGAERDSSPRSMRYAGHQVNPRQAMALLTARGWLTVPGEGIRRTFHAEGLSAWLELLNGGYTPAEVEGLTLESVVFHRVGELFPMPLADVPPRVFSEVMRDLDLVVSVAHMGGVDPEASASTVEMRSALIQETCAMLHLTNVRLQGTHALVDGQLGHYSVHLGSAVVHRMPGGALCIVPVYSQHRGRLFLPFADDDPKTAETVSKILLLARDKEIQDPSILEQILA